jgi:hypothetical protein
MLSELLKGQNLSAYAKGLVDTLQERTLDLPSPPTLVQRVEARPKERAREGQRERAKRESMTHSRCLSLQ